VGGVSADEAERRARALLTRAAEPGDVRIGRLVATAGAVETVRRLVAGDPDIGGVERYQARIATCDVGADLDRVGSVGGRLVVPGDLEWPSQLGDLGPLAPWALWVRGTADLRLSALRSVAVVGARASTAYGTHVASMLASDLALAGWSVVSGGAFGIDAAAHGGSLAVGGVTVAVLACGVDVSYPPRHDALFARIAGEGVLVSEVPPGAAPHRTRFLVRNRVIAALTRGTVVVEAALRSGSLSTAHEAGKLGRPVLVVPGPITSVMSQGVHRELRRGATAVTSASEIVEAVGSLGVDLADEPSGPVDPRDSLDRTAARVLDAVPVRRPATVESIARTAGLAPPEVAAALSLLELAEFVRSRPTGWTLVPRRGVPR
jgi:DNA processing protein